MLKIILLTNLILSMIMIMMKSPLYSNLIIMFQSIMLTILINLINKTSWISFMIFILYIGGMMIIFLYISSIAFNELNLNKNYKKSFFKMIFILLLISLINKYLLLENFNFNNNFMFEDNYFFINMFILPNNLFIYLILLILFFLLIMIIWMLKINKGPIRQKK